jgi:cyanophycinase
MPLPEGINNHRNNGHIIPKGTLVAIGGNEDKDNDLEILRATLAESSVPEPSIALITTASAEPEVMAERYQEAFGKIGTGPVHVLDIKTRDEVLTGWRMAQVRDADVIFFTGGDQLRITSTLGGSQLSQEVKRKYFEEGCVVAGTSAGASALSETMIYEGESSEALKKGSVQMTSGMGLVQKVIIDSHFIRRGRFSRLMTTVTANPGIIGLGLGEDTGVIIREGHKLEAIGGGLIVILDGRQIVHSNIAEIEIGQAIAVQNVIVHTLVKGYGFDLLTREYLITT